MVGKRGEKECAIGSTLISYKGDLSNGTHPNANHSIPRGSNGMAWRSEISWGANPAELRHLMGRIGELYVAMFTNGNLAENVNEKGYDVVSKDNERISVKTTTRSEGRGHVAFNPNTLNYC